MLKLSLFPSAKRGSPMARIGLGSLAQFCQRVGTALHAGIDVRRIMDSEVHRGSPRQRDVMRQLQEQIAAGESLASALAHSNGYFPPLLPEMVAVGERTGRLEEVFIRLGEHYQHLLSLRRTFLIGIAWPLIELGLALFVVGLLIWILGAIGAEWDGKPLSVMGLHGTSGLLIYVGILGAIACACGLTVTAVRRGWIDLDPLYRLLMNVPGIGTGLRTMAMSRLTWSLALATDSDLDIKRAVELGVRSTQNSYYTSHLEKMVRRLQEGETLHTAFRAAGVYPTEFLDALETGETAGQVSEMMANLAEQYEDRTRTFCKLLAVVAGVAVLLLVFGIIIFFIFQLAQLYLMPIYDTLDSI
jgi:type II secretory pathway component PulF